MKNPFSPQQLKEMADKIEAICVHNLWSYNVAASNTRDARRYLFSIIHDDDKRKLVFSEESYNSQVDSGIKFLQSRRRQEKERLEAYLATEERAIDARTMQRDKTLEERGGSTYDILCRMNQVGIPGPDY
jgi:hypothetical protein